MLQVSTMLLSHLELQSQFGRAGKQMCVSMVWWFLRLNVTAHISTAPALKLQMVFFSGNERLSQSDVQWPVDCEWCGGDLRAILSPIVHLLPPFTCI